MTSFTYWPYDEVSLDAKTPGALTLKAPWMEATTSAAPWNPVAIARLSNGLNSKKLGVDDIVLVNDFFRHFHDYPLAYILPNKKDDETSDHHQLVDQTNLTCSFDEALSNILVSHGSFCGADVERVLTRLPRVNFEWDQEAALNFSSLDEMIHPESIFSIARRYHLLELITNDRGKEIFNNIKKRGAREFRAAVARLLRQNHFVTEQCQRALRPAVSIAQQSAPLIKEFMAAERGHDLILRKALLHLQATPEDIEVSPQTEALMILLTHMAERNFLAFAMAVDAFERNNYEEIDPMAKLLIDAGFEKAADFINLHMKINDQGGHDNVAQKFLRPMALCDRAYALEALRLMETLSVVMCSISLSAEG